MNFIVLKNGPQKRTNYLNFAYRKHPLDVSTYNVIAHNLTGDHT